MIDWVIDWERVGELRGEIGEKDFAQILAYFIEEADDAMQKLRAADAPRLVALLHFLKGSALNLGLRAFAEQCRLEEVRAAGGDTSSVGHDSLLLIYETSKEALLAETGKGHAA